MCLLVCSLLKAHTKEYLFLQWKNAISGLGEVNQEDHVVGDAEEVELMSFL